jgi:fused signal recognition particle receptor
MFGLFKKFCKGLSKTKRQLFQKLGSIFHSGRINPENLEVIEEALYAADFGVETSEEMIVQIRQAYRENRSLQKQDIAAITAHVLRGILQGSEGCLVVPVSTKASSPEILYLVGTNGSGKTTTAAKCAHYFQQQGRSVIVGACDTFRMAANEQMTIWSQRLGFELVSSQHGADAVAVAYDTYKAACHRQKDLVILDTAGRLHTKDHLMQELVKMKRVLSKQIDPSFEHTWLVLDGSLGANAITSAQQFYETLGLSGMIMTKLDGTSRGGALVGIYRQLRIPIYFLGLGEQAEDLQPFSSEDYIRALLEEVPKSGD